VLVSSTPVAYAASPFGKAVLFLDNVGSHLVSFSIPTFLLTKKTEEEIQTDTGELPENVEVAEETDTQTVGPKREIVRYVVEDGDTLSRIAQDFGISLATLTFANNLTTRSTLRLGQELSILPVDGVEHTVKSGETVSHIAKKYQTDVDEIITFNNIHSEGLIKPGQKLIVPGATPAASTATLAVQKSAPSASVVQTTSSAAPPVDVAGYFIFPVSGKITQGLHFLNAVDMGGSTYCGTPVKVAASGTVITVTNSGWNGGYGNYVKVAHPNGTETIYAHNARNIVVLGQEVTQGEVIAYLGRSGNATGCHVHFAVRGASNPFAY